MDKVRHRKYFVTRNKMNLEFKSFADVNLSDPFFDSLKLDYVEFGEWFSRKAEKGESAYVFYNDVGVIDGFLYIKVEDGAVVDVEPPLRPAKRVKVGTMKINAHGTKLGERFLKKVFDHAVVEEADEIYVTVLEKHKKLIDLFEKYGFKEGGTKANPNGTEIVLVKSMFSDSGAHLQNYPLIHTNGRSIYLLSIYPEWHTRLLPDSILKNEDASIVQDISHTNSIHKVYLAKMRGMEGLKPGDILLIYRTKDGAGPAHYRSVATSICIIEEYRNINSFNSRDEFMNYCEPYSVFTNEELNTMWQRKTYPHIIRFTYNIAFQKRVTRAKMIEDVGLNASDYWGFMRLSVEELHSICSLGEMNENLIVD